MPITPFLSGRSFQPETLQCMGVAFETACKELGLADKAHPFTQTVAELVITFADKNERDPIALSQRVLDTLRKR
jgi:hypothetical protein